jgi:hypothetical protein
MVTIPEPEKRGPQETDAPDAAAEVDRLAGGASDLSTAPPSHLLLSKNRQNTENP